MTSPFDHAWALLKMNIPPSHPSYVPPPEEEPTEEELEEQYLALLNAGRTPAPRQG